MWSYEKLPSELAEMFDTTLQDVCAVYDWNSEIKAAIQLANSFLVAAKPERIRMRQCDVAPYFQFEFETWENNGSHYSGWYDCPLPANYVKHVEGFDLETKRAYLTFQIALIAGVDVDSIQSIQKKLFRTIQSTVGKSKTAARKVLKEKLQELQAEQDTAKALLG